jgi:hypothetical protein
MRFLKNKRLLAGVAIVVAIVAMAMWPESVDVSVAKVERGPMQVTLDEDGETRIRDKFIVLGTGGRTTAAHRALNRAIRSCVARRLSPG